VIPALPEPQFIDRDPDVITASLVARFEELTGRPLQPAQVERLLINLLAYQDTLTRIAIQEAAKQNLLAYARFPMLDHLGALLNVERLAAKPAHTTMRFVRSVDVVGDVVVPAGTGIRTGDGKVVFKTTRTLLVPADAASADVPAEAEAAGVLGNGYAPGQVSALAQPVEGITGAVNVVDTTGGAEVEDDEPFRERIREAPESFTNAGSREAYRFHARSVHQDIIDVAVVSPVPGRVAVYVLWRYGQPDQDLLDAVQAKLSGEKVRPLTDTVAVSAAVRVPYVLRARIEVNPDADAIIVLGTVQAAAVAWATGRRATLGGELVDSQIIKALHLPGVYRVILDSPTETILRDFEWADAETVKVMLDG
jgi:phage-related baseplate assembly protein